MGQLHGFHKKKAIFLFLISSLLILNLASKVSPITINDTNVIVKTTSNNTQFTMGTPLSFHRMKVNSTQLRLDQSYTNNKYTRYYIYVISPSNVNLTIQSWFATANSSATLTVSAPTSTNIALGFHSPELITASIKTSQRVSQTYTVANQTLNFVVNTDTASTFTISVSATETDEANITPENHSFNVTDMEGCGNWVFSEEQSYHFEAKYWDGNGWADLDTVSIGFTDDMHQINASYDVSAGTFSLDSGGTAVRLADGIVTVEDANLLEVIFLLYFEQDILDALNVDVWMFCNDTDGASDNWEVFASDFFHIYNLGGHSTLTTGGNGESGRVTGGDIFDLFVNTNVSGTTFAEATMTFRNLQHIKMLPRINYVRATNEPTPYFTLTYAISYCVNDIWVEGFSLKLKEDIQAAGSLRHFNWTIEFYQGDNEILDQRIFFYFLADSAVPSIGENSTGVIWVDMWFNKINASSVGGSRVNAYMFPMKDSSNPWLRWLVGSNWGINEGVPKQRMFFTNLLDNDGNLIHTQEISMVNISCRLEVTLASGRATNLTVQVSDYDVFDLTLGRTEPFSGVQTPPFDETKIPYLPQGGFLGALWSYLTGLFNWIADALGPSILGFFQTFVDFMDSIAAYFGAPGLFSIILGLFSNFFAWLTDSIIWVVSLITTGMAAATVTMGKFANTVSTIVGQWIAMIQSFFSFLGGTYTGGINVWTDLGLPNWILLGAILYPLYLLEVAATKGIDAAINQVMFLVNIGAFIVAGFLTIVQMAISLIVRIIESIPVVE